MELILLLGATAIALVAGYSIISLSRAKKSEEKAEQDFLRAKSTGALPPSLYPRIDPGRCIGCNACVKSCPEVEVLGIVNGKAEVVNPTSCIGHGECARSCPTDAIRLVLGHEMRGVDIPLVAADFQTNVPGIYVIGELGGMGLIYNAMTQGLQCMKKVVESAPPRTAGAHQVAIVGAGPAGLAASLVALEAKLDFTTLDQESVGGTVLQYPRRKIVMTRPVELPIYGKVEVKSVHKEDLLQIWNDILAKTGLSVRTGVRVESIHKRDDGTFELKTSSGPILAQRVVLALGRRGSPRKLGVAGESMAKVAYRLLEPEQYAGTRCLVIGGGDAAVEAAIALGEANAEVHLAHRGEIFDRIKSKNQARLDQAVADKRVTLLLKAEAKEIREDSVEVEVRSERKTIQNDFVLIFAGGVLPTAFLEGAGIVVQTYKGETFAPAN